MKNLILAVFAAFAIACNSSEGPKNTEATSEVKAEEGMMYGEKFTVNSPASIDEVISKMGDQDEMKAQVQGKVSSVCKAEGCWLKMAKADGGEVMVKMKGHDFTVPKDCEGKTVVIDGVARKETTSVEDLKHFAEDEGKTKEEIDAITQAEEEIVIEANGVIFQ